MAFIVGPRSFLPDPAPIGTIYTGAGIEVVTDVEGVGASFKFVFLQGLCVVTRRDSFIGTGAGSDALAERVLRVQSQAIVGSLGDRDLKRVVAVFSSAGLYVDFGIRSQRPYAQVP